MLVPEAHPSQLRRQWPGLNLGRVVLGTAPTPVRPMETVTVGREVGLWAKREDAYGDGAWGGNKVRKLEWILAEAQRRGVRTLLTVGGTGTNWGLVCATYGAVHGFRTVLGLVDQPEDDRVREHLVRLQDSGAVIHRYPDRRALRRALPGLMLRHAFGGASGRTSPRFPWYLPIGGSNTFGTLGYVEVGLEIAEQVRAGTLPEPATLVVPVGSGGTVAGLALGLRAAGLATRILGVVVNDSVPLDAGTLVGLANGTGRLLRQRGARGVPTLTVHDLDVRRDWLGRTYGDPTPEALEAVAAAAEVGLVLEPVYTGKALAAIAALGTSLPSPVLWLDTYGPR